MDTIMLTALFLALLVPAHAGEVCVVVPPVRSPWLLREAIEMQSGNPYYHFFRGLLVGGG